jgi:hypothetical protein
MELGLLSRRDGSRSDAFYHSVKINLQLSAAANPLLDKER